MHHRTTVSSSYYIGKKKTTKYKESEKAWAEFQTLSFDRTFSATSLCLLRHDGSAWQELIAADLSDQIG